MKIYAIIPARGGSKGLPDKNIRKLGSTALIARAVESARKSKFINRIFVSTDSKPIASAAANAGAEIIERPAEISGDTASSETALQHGLEYMKIQEGELPDILVFLQCTSPFITPEDIDGTIQALIEKNASSALTVSKFEHFIWQTCEDGAIGINHDGKNRVRRQDLNPQYIENGAVYVMRTEDFLHEKTRFCGKTVLHESSSPCLEIDNEVDFYISEALDKWLLKSEFAKNNYKNGNENWLPAKLGALVCDFDGVFTDNAVLTTQDCEEIVRCGRDDGEGISSLKSFGLPVIVLSAEIGSVVSARCKKLNLECMQGVRQKKECLENWLKQNDLKWENIVYIGNDIKDKECLRYAGAGVIPNDAHPCVHDIADYKLEHNGGHGAIRELCDLICDGIKAGRIEILQKKYREIPYYTGQTSNRPWGKWEILDVNENFCIKKITIRPGEELSLQYHHFRNEIWIILRGIGEVIQGDTTICVKPWEKINIEKLTVHSIKNISTFNLELIEIQTGEAFRESDIVRIKDKYHRDQ